MESSIYYKIIDGEKKYYLNHKLLGGEFEMKKYFVNEERMSYSKATKAVGKVKEYVEKKSK